MSAKAPPTLPTWLDLAETTARFFSYAWHRSHRGVQLLKFAEDLDRYRAAIQATRPDVVVECGVWTGGSSLWFADQGVDVVAVDLHPDRSKPAHDLTDRVTWVLGASSTAADTVQQVRELVDGRRCMVTLDSDHHAPHVEAEIRAYAPLVSPGCHLVVEDGLADLMGYHGRRTGERIPEEGGPLAAVAATVATWPGWVRDEQIERMFPVTHNPGGWWRRVS